MHAFKHFLSNHMQRKKNNWWVCKYCKSEYHKSYLFNLGYNNYAKEMQKEEINMHIIFIRIKLFVCYCYGINILIFI